MVLLKADMAEPKKKIYVRAWAPKRKTGCKTCKIRHVKCDETKPACRKCTSTGRKCDGYPALPSSITSYSQTATPTNLPPLSPSLSHPLWSLSTAPTQDAKQHRAFSYFVNCTAPELTGFYSTNLWDTRVPCRIFGDEALFCCVVAVASLHESLASGIHTSSSAPNSSTYNRTAHLTLYTYALKHYTRALNLLQRSISTCSNDSKSRDPSKQTPNLESILLSCALLVTFDSLRGNYTSASTHLRGGLGILLREKRATERTQNASVGHGIANDEGLVRAFTNLALQAGSYMDGGVRPESVSAVWEWTGEMNGFGGGASLEGHGGGEEESSRGLGGLGDGDWEFKSVDDARHTLNLILSAFLLHHTRAWAAAAAIAAQSSSSDKTSISASSLSNSNYNSNSDSPSTLPSPVTASEASFTAFTAFPPPDAYSSPVTNLSTPDLCPLPFSINYQDSTHPTTTETSTPNNPLSTSTSTHDPTSIYPPYATTLLTFPARRLLTQWTTSFNTFILRLRSSVPVYHAPEWAVSSGNQPTPEGSTKATSSSSATEDLRQALLVRVQAASLMAMVEWFLWEGEPGERDEKWEAWITGHRDGYEGEFLDRGTACGLEVGALMETENFAGGDADRGRNEEGRDRNRNNNSTSERGATARAAKSTLQAAAAAAERATAGTSEFESPSTAPYETIVRLAKELISGNGRAAGRREQTRKGNSKNDDLFLVGPLIVTVARCRIPAVRAEALALLRSVRRGEGVWDAEIAANIAIDVLEMEEARNPGGLHDMMAIDARIQKERIVVLEGKLGRIEGRIEEMGGGVYRPYLY